MKKTDKIKEKTICFIRLFDFFYVILFYSAIRMICITRNENIPSHSSEVQRYKKLS